MSDCMHEKIKLWRKGETLIENCRRIGISDTSGYMMRKKYKLTCKNKESYSLGIGLLICKGCGKEQKIRNSILKKRKFCSQKCAWKYKYKITKEKVLSAYKLEVPQPDHSSSERNDGKNYAGPAWDEPSFVI